MSTDPPAEPQDGSPAHPGEPPAERVAALLEAARGGDRAALDTLLELHEPGLESWARRRLGTSLRTLDETRDVLHDAYRVVIERLDAFEMRGEGSFGRWLRGIVTRIVLRKADSPHVRRRDAFPAASTPADPDLTPMTRASVEELEALRWRVLRTYERTDRLVYRLRTRGCSSVAIGERLGVSDRAVRMRYAKTETRLRMEIARRAREIGGPDDSGASDDG